MTNDELKEPDFEKEYLEDYEGPLESCPACGSLYNEIDFYDGKCSKCNFDANNDD